MKGINEFDGNGFQFPPEEQENSPLLQLQKIN
jgi:hypothetical protein